MKKEVREVLDQTLPALAHLAVAAEILDEHDDEELRRRAQAKWEENVETALEGIRCLSDSLDSNAA